MENLKLSEGGNSSSSAHPLRFLGPTEENRKCEKKEGEKEESEAPIEENELPLPVSIPFTTMYDVTWNRCGLPPCERDFYAFLEEKNVATIRVLPQVLPERIYGTCIKCGCSELFQDRPRGCCAKLHGTRCVFNAADRPVCDTPDLRSTRKKHKEVYGRGPITSILLADDRQAIAITSRRLANKGATADKTGVRTCPWDGHFCLIPILDKETGEIAGYGKKDMNFGRCGNDSYSKEGEKEWMSFFTSKIFTARKRPGN